MPVVPHPTAIFLLCVLLLPCCLLHAWSSPPSLSRRRYPSSSSSSSSSRHHITAGDTLTFTRVRRLHSDASSKWLNRNVLILFESSSDAVEKRDNLKEKKNESIHEEEDEETSSSTIAAVVTDEKVSQEVEALRRRAQELKKEARILEAALSESRSSTNKKRKQEESNLMDKLFLNRPLTPEAVAHVMRHDRWSADQALLVLDGLQDRLEKVSTYTVMQDASSAAPFVIGDPRNLERNETENVLISSQMDCLIQAAQLLDDETTSSSSTKSSEESKGNSTSSTDISSSSGSNDIGTNARWTGRVAVSLKSRRNERQRARNEELQRQLLVATSSTASGQLATAEQADSNTTVQEYMRRTLGLPVTPIEEQDSTGRTLNVTRVMEQVAMVPLWVPSTLLSFLVADKNTIAPSDIRTIKDKVLTGSRFFCTSSDSIPSAAVFRGNIRIVTGEPANVTAQIFADIQKRMENMEEDGLSDRVQLFFQQDAEWKPNRDEREPEPKPVILAVPASVDPDESRIKKDTLTVTLAKRASIALSIAATLGYSIGCYALNTRFFKSVINQQDLSVLSSCLPVFIGLFAVQAIHELAHIGVARWRKIKIGRPLPLPSSQLGLFGCITPLRSFPANRADMLDFALSGPIAGLLTSILLMIFGINMTTHASGVTLSQFPVVPVSLLKSSFLTGTLLTFLAPKVMMLPLSQPVPIHPFFMVGFSCLLSSALNLLPIFRLDGGRACSAAMGSRFGAVASAGTLLFMLSLILSGGSSLAFNWALLIVFFQRRQEIPPRDDVTEVDDVRLGGWIASLATAVLALAPFPGGPGVL